MRVYNNWKYDVQIGKFSKVSDKVIFSPDITDSNVISAALASGKFGGQIIIMNDCCVEDNVVIRGNVRIGSGAYLMAGAVVAKNVPPYAIVAGNPAKIVGYRFSKPDMEALNLVRWWNWDEKKINVELSQDNYKVADIITNNVKAAEDDIRSIVPANVAYIEKTNKGEEKILLYVPDFDADEPTYPKVIEGFVERYSDTNYELLLYIDDDNNLDGKLDKLNIEFAKYEDANCYVNLYVSVLQDKRGLMGQVDAYITNASDDNVEYIDMAELFSLPVILHTKLSLEDLHMDMMQMAENDVQPKQDVRNALTVDVFRKFKEAVDKHLDNIYSQFEEFSMIQYSINHALENVRYEVFADEVRPKYPIIASEEETVDKLINEGKSICRFGDGEISVILGEDRQAFQRPDKKLGARLSEVLNSKDENILIGIADNYGDLTRYNLFSRYNIRAYMTEETRAKHYSVLDFNRKYYDAYMSRPYVDRADNKTDGPKRRFDRLKQIWAGREIVIIEGHQTRMGVGNDLFDDASDVKRILGPAVDAYDRYDEILEETLKQDKSKLIIISMGATATVLAYDLAKAGYQALDLGHIDLEYEWMLKGEGRRVEIKNKYNNEFNGGDQVEEINDPIYEKQIVARIY